MYIPMIPKAHTIMPNANIIIIIREVYPVKICSGNINFRITMNTIPRMLAKVIKIPKLNIILRGTTEKEVIASVASLMRFIAE